MILRMVSLNELRTCDVTFSWLSDQSPVSSVAL